MRLKPTMLRIEIVSKRHRLMIYGISLSTQAIPEELSQYQA